MALEGTLRDFSIADIFQLIGLQRKNGVLTLKREGEVVTVSFSEGAVVAADTLNRPLEDRLGTVLVKSGKLTEARLQEALAVQKKTLQRLGYIVVQKRFVEPLDLREALNTQITQIVFRLFRWKSGDYHFSQESEVDYDRENFDPIPADNILMEGARMMDEWPIIERRIPSFDLVFHPAGGRAGRAGGSGSSVYEEDIDFDLLGDESRGEEDREGLRLGREEAEVVRLVDGRRTVQEIIDSTALGEFDTCRVLCELLDRKLIQQAPSAGEAVERRVPLRARIPWAALGTLLMAAVAAASALLALGQIAGLALRLEGVPGHPGHSRALVQRALALPDLRLAISRTRLDRVDRALHGGAYLKLSLYPDLLDTGHEDRLLPALRAEGASALEDLADPAAARAAGYGHPLLSPSEIVDTRGRPFGYDRGYSGGGRVLYYEIGGIGPSGQPDSRLFLHRELWALLPRLAPPGPETPPPADLDTAAPGS
jgi:hypothetical protein